MATNAGTIHHRHQSLVPPAGADIDTPQWNDSEVMAGGLNGQVCMRDAGQPDGWGWGSVAALDSPALTGTPTAPTAAAGTNTTQIATTAFVQSAMPGGTRGSVYHSAVQSIASATWTVLAFDSAFYALAGIGSGGTYLVVPASGIYLVHAAVSFAGNATGERGVSFQRNQSGFERTTYMLGMNMAAGVPQVLSVSDLVSLNANDRYGVQAYQISGANLSTGSTNLTYPNRFFMVRLF